MNANFDPVSKQKNNHVNDMAPQVIDLSNPASYDQNNGKGYVSPNSKPGADGGTNVINLADYPGSVNYPDPNAATVEGTPLYPDEVPQNPHLARFVKSGCKDVWAAILFAIMVLFTVVFGIVNMATYKLIDDGISDPDDFSGVRTSGNATARFDVNSDNDDDDREKAAVLFTIATTVVLVVLCTVVSFVTSFVSMMVIRCFPKQLIYIANVFSILMLLASAVMTFVAGQPVLGIILLVMVGLQALWLFLVRNRIPFSAALLRAASDVVNRNKSLVLVSVLSIVSLAAYMVFWGYSILRPTDRLAADKGNGGDVFLICLLVLIFFWVAQVIPNTMHVVTSGVVATWYFAGHDNMPKRATLKSFIRATTTSFGSICFGSLLVAIIQFLRWLAESSRNNDDGDNACLNLLRCVLICILRLIEDLLQYFNTYAFVHVAVYGCDYISAARRTFGLIQQCVFTAYFTDALIGPVLGMLALAISVLIGAVVGLLFLSWAIGVVGFFIALVVHGIVFTTITSAVNTIFVCFAEVPEGLQASDPELYRIIYDTDSGMTNNNAPSPNAMP